MLAVLEVQSDIYRDFDDTPFAVALGENVDAKVSFEVIQRLLRVGRFQLKCVFCLFEKYVI